MRKLYENIESSLQFIPNSNEYTSNDAYTPEQLENIQKLFDTINANPGIKLSFERTRFNYLRIILQKR